MLQQHRIFKKTDIELLNKQFDDILSHKFSTEYVAMTAVRAILERFSINLPMLHPSPINMEYTFHIQNETNSECYLYIVLEKDIRGHVDIFAQVVDGDELDALKHMNIRTPDVIPPGQILPYTSNYLRQTRRTSDN